MNLSGDITKYDQCEDGSLVVCGVVSNEDRDNAGEVVTADAMRKAIPAYMQSPSAREMHQPIAAGRTLDIAVDDSGATHARVLVVDPGTIAKVKAGVLRGFSIGGTAIRKAGKSILELVLREISLVDSPCNPSCLFSIQKFSTSDTPTATPDPIMTDDITKSLAAITETLTAINKRLETAETKLATPATTPAPITKVDLGNGTVVDLADIAKRFDTMQTTVEANAREAVITKMVRDGRTPLKGDGVAYTLDELRKCDLTTLNIFAVNAPKLPLNHKAVLKMDATVTGPAITKVTDPKVTGVDKTAHMWEQQFKTLEDCRATAGGN